MQAKDIFFEGVGLLESVFSKHGFAYVKKEEGNSSGGYFYSGMFQKDDAKIHFSFRHSLGVVKYTVGDYEFDHKSFMRSLNILDNKYPNFSDRPLDGFIALKYDLENFGRLFLGNIEDRQDIVKRMKKLPPMKIGLDAI